MLSTIGFLAALLASPLQSFANLDWAKPKTFASVSGERTLEVVPSHTFGEGPAACVLRQNGQVVWEKELPVTLTEAVISESGVIAGYGQSGQQFRIFIAGPDGSTRLVKVSNRASLSPDGTQYPWGRGVVLDEARKRVAMIFQDLKTEPESEIWQVYRLSDAELIATWKPRAKIEQTSSRRLWYQEARAVPELPLTLIWYWRVDHTDESLGYPREGAYFSLINDRGEEVWHHELASDYTVEDDRTADHKRMQLVTETGAIREMTPSGFVLWFVRDQEHIEFEVGYLPTESGWEVKVVRRTPVDSAGALSSEPDSKEL